MTATAVDVGGLVVASAAASREWAARPRGERAAALRAVADRLDAAADELVPIAMDESHLPEPRLRGELGRTTFQLRLFAEVVEDGAYLGARIDHADPDWGMGPRPDLRRTRVPLGPVVVFAASNFPFAFSVAGGDTASALAAGCSVLLKAHPGHPALSVATAAVVEAALAHAGAPDGVFALVVGDEAGREALTHPLVRAGAFTGSLTAGRILFDLAMARPEPIPFYGELGSINPVVVTPEADADRGAEIAEGLVTSFTLGAGQFCTKPGVVLVPVESVLLETLRATSLPGAVPMLNERIADGYRHASGVLRAHALVDAVSVSPDPLAPAVLRTTVDAALADPDVLLAECFGPTVLLLEYHDRAELFEFVAELDGQLTATLIADEPNPGVAELVALLAPKVGRLLWNQWPTGVSVTYAQQHGGPYPATTAPGTTSVGTAAIDRFTRPVAFQGFPTSLLPVELRDPS